MGVDAGGSNTRALAVDASGRVVGTGTTKGGNPNHDSSHRENVRSAIARAAGARLSEVVRVVAGIAGLDDEKDRGWAAESTDVPGMTAVRVEVNDAEVAHYGALQGQPGIVSIQGTGSIVVAITADGRRVRNYDFGHYAYSGSPWIGQRAAWLLLARGPSEGDAELLDGMLRHWEMPDLEAFRACGQEDWRCTYEVKRRRFGQMAPLVTAQAEAGSTTAQEICRACGGQVVEAVRLLGRYFAEGEVPVALIGSCVQSPAIRRHVEEGLRSALERSYLVVDPAFPPVVGAVLMALDQEGVQVTSEMLAVINQHGAGQARGDMPSE